MNLSEKIQLCRKRAGLSQEALAEKLNVSRQAVSKWETGAAEPELSKLRALAAAFGVTADWLLSEEDAGNGNSFGESAGAREDGAANSGSARANSASNTVGEPNTAPGDGFTCGDSGSNDESNAAPGDGSAANADGFCKSSAESDGFTDGDSTDKGSSGQGEGHADTASGASAHPEESSASNASADGQAVNGRSADFHSASSSPNWVESVPGVLGRLLRQYGWIIGLRMAVSGALMTFIGFLGRAAVRSMDQSFGLGFEMVPSQTAWYDDAGNLMTSPISMPSQPSDPVTILCTGMIVLGVILILAGICIAVSLRNQHRE